MILLVSFFFWIHYFFSSITSHCGSGVASCARRRHQHSRIVDPDPDAAVRLLAGTDGRDFTLRDRTRADVFRQRLYRQA